MSGLNSIAMPKSTKRGNGGGLGLGILGLGAACLGCCLAPLLGIFLATGAGASMAAMLSSRPVLVGILGGTLVLGVAWLWMLRKKSCCSNPGVGCSETQCQIHPADSGSKGAQS